MEIGFSESQAQRVLKQRNILVLASVGLGIVAIFALIAASARDREVVLQPVLTRPVTLSSAGVSKEYLELVTRDTALLMLNRTPSSVEYWLDEVLRITHPTAHGRIKGDLLKIVSDQQGSSVSQYFTLEGMQVDPETLRSQVTGTLHTVVGRQEVSAVKRTFRFDWTYTGIELRLVGFGAVMPQVPDAPGASPPAGGAEPQL